MRRCARWLVLAAGLLGGGCGNTPGDLEACVRAAWAGLRPVAEDRARRFLGKVGDERARCRGGVRAVELRRGPWVDWPHYWATGDGGSRISSSDKGPRLLRPDRRGIGGALIDLEYQRIELIRFNLFDNRGRTGSTSAGATGPRPRDQGLARDAATPGASGPRRRRRRRVADLPGELIRFRTLTGHLQRHSQSRRWVRPAAFGRNVEFEATFPDRSSTNELARNRHGGRLASAEPDPQVISRRLLHPAGDAPTRATTAGDCHATPPRRTAPTRQRRSSTCWRPSGSSS